MLKIGRPKLSESYEGLVKQFSAVWHLYKSQEQQLSYYQEKVAEFEEYHKLHSEQEFNALRDIIEILTNRIEELEK